MIRKVHHFSAVMIGLIFLGLVQIQCSKDNSFEEMTARLEESLSAASPYESGQSRVALSEIDEIVKAVVYSPKERATIEERFITFLQSDASLESKQFICRKLSILGSEASLPTLSGMLQEEETFDMALYALERIPSDRVDETLRGMITKFEGRMKIGLVNALGVRRDGQSVSTFQKLITDQDEELAKAAVSALGRIANEEATQALEETASKITGSVRASVMDAYLECADRMADDGEDDKARSIYRRLMAKDYPDQIRRAALTGMILTNPDGAGEMILNTIRSDDFPIVSTALYHVSRLSRIDNLKEIVNELPNLASIHQIQLIAGLAERGDRSFLKPVVDATASDDVSVRIAAFRALASLGDASSVELLSRIATQGGTEADAARESLYLLRGEEVNQAIITKMTDAEPKVKGELLRSVGARTIKSATETVLTYTKDSNLKVREEAIKTLGHIAAPKYIPELIEILMQAQTPDERREAERTVTTVARQIEDVDNQGKDVLAATPVAKSIEVKSSLLTVLGRIGDAHALPEIRSTIESKNLELQKAGIRALSEWPTAEPMDDLLNVAETSREKVLQILALRGYIRSIGIDTAHTDDEKPQMYQKAFDLSSEINEKRMVLSGLAEIRSMSALDMAARYLGDPSLQNEAEVAVVRIAQRIWREHPQETLPYLNRVVRSSSNEEVRQRAQGLIDRINE